MKPFSEIAFNKMLELYNNHSHEVGSELFKQDPTDPSRELDHRYVDFAEAMRYLERMIAENTLEPLTQRLARTRQRITDALGES